MELIKTKHYGTPLDVIFIGKYLFLDAFHGLVAVVDLPEANEEDMTLTYKIEYTSVIDKYTIERVIKKQRSDMQKKFGLIEQYKLKFDYVLIREVSSLPYYIEINLKKMNL